MITAVDWQALIARWVRDYRVTESKAVRSYLEPRGLTAIGFKMRRLDRYAITGRLAGPGIAEAGANLSLLEPYDDVVFERTQSLPFTPAPEKFKVTAPAPSQVAADLMTSPGRSHKKRK